MPPEIRRLDEHLFEGYRTLRLRALKEEPAAFTSSWEEEVAKDDTYWRSRIHSDVVQMFCAVEQDHVLGMSGLSFEPRKKKQHKVTLIAVYVEPEHRGRGVGKQLVEHCLIAAFSRAQIESVKLTVTGQNVSALGLYEYFGFERWAEEKRALKIGDQYCSKVYMECGRLAYNDFRARLPH